MNILLVAWGFGAWKNTTQLEKYPHAYVKRSNKMYLFHVCALDMRWYIANEARSYLISNKSEWNNCFIKNTQRNTSKSATIIFVVNGFWAHVSLPVNQLKFRIRNVP